MKLSLALAAPMSIAGCGASESPDSGTTESEVNTGLEIAGTWSDDFGGTHIIDEVMWRQEGAYGPAVFSVLSYDNAAAQIIAQNAADADYNPGLFSRFDWTWSADEVLYFCQSVFDAATEEDAAVGPAPDASAVDSTGCGGFAWTRLHDE